MRVLILGSAAGGGFPQWNCRCPNCSSVRAGTFHGKARSQTQVAISADGNSWFLLGASPDLRYQIESMPALQPCVNNSSQDIRQSPIAGAVFANADIDHVLGLLLLRELQPLSIHATLSVRRILSEDNSMFAMLNRVRGQLTWTEFEPDEEFPLLNADSEDSGLTCLALSLGRHYPAYVTQFRQTELSRREASLGLFIESSTGKRLAFLPAVPQIDNVLLHDLESTDVVLLDGTFWSDDELIRIQGHGQTAEEMGHVPVEESLRRLAELRHPRKIYLHINNTNPMLDESSAEHRQVRDAGWEIAEDGWQFEL